MILDGEEARNSQACGQRKEKEKIRMIMEDLGKGMGMKKRV
jgi:hypothetical protein